MNYPFQRLWNLLRVFNGYAFKKSEYKTEWILLFRQGNLNVDKEKSVYLPFDYLEKYKNFLIQKWDVLIWMSGSIGMYSIYNREYPAIQNQRVWKLIFQDTVFSKYVLYYLPIIEGKLKLKAKWVAVLNISWKDLESIEIPLPSLSIQNLIVSEIEKQFSRLDEWLSSLLRIRANLKSYRASLLKSAIEWRLTEEWRAENPDIESADMLLDRIRNARRDKWLSENPGKKYKEPKKVKEWIEDIKLPSNWCWSNGEELFDYITSGSRGWAKYYSSEWALFLRMTNLDHGTLNLDLRDLQFVALPKNSTEGLRTRLQARDILISITADVWMIAQIPDEFKYEAYINQHVCLARPSLLLRNSYIGFLFISSLIQKQLKKSQRWATKVGLGLDDIRNLKIPLPPLLEQHYIVEILEEKFSVIDSLESLVNANIRRAENLKQAILKKAFSGELIKENT